MSSNDPRVVDPTRPSSPDAFYPDGAPAPHDWSNSIAYLTQEIQRLEQTLRSSKRVKQVSDVVQESLDDSGNAVFAFYQVGAGFYFNLTQVCIEAEGYTPAAPYANADAWLGLFVTKSNVGNPAQGQMFDFLPTTDGGQLFPGVGDYDPPGRLARSTDYLVCRVAGGPANKRVTVRFDGLLVGEEV